MAQCLDSSQHIEDYTLKKTKRGRPKKAIDSPILPAKKNISTNAPLKSYIVKLNITHEDLQFYKKALPDTYQQGSQSQNTLFNYSNQLNHSNYSNQLNHSSQQSNHSSQQSNHSNHSSQLNHSSQQYNTTYQENQTETINNMRDMCNTNINFVGDFYNETVVPLFIGNVPVKTFGEELETDTYINNYKKNTTEFIAPMLDVGNNQWPKTSPYACWNCDCYFTGTPVGIPVSESNGFIYCEGNYCDFPCALRALMDSSSYDDKSTKISFLYMLYNLIYDDYDLQPALPKIVMLKYGGKYSESEYHNYNNSDKIIEVYKLPTIPTLFKVLEVEKTQSIANIMKIKPLKGRSKGFVPIDEEVLKRAKEAVQALKKG